MLLPGLMLLIIFKYVPMYGVLIAFKDFNPRKGMLASEWVGLKYFKQFLNLPSFGQLFSNTLRLSTLSTVVGYFAPIILALLVNQVKYDKLKDRIQLISYAPNFVSTVIVCGMLFIIFSPTGPVNMLLKNMGVDPIPFMTSNQWFIPMYILSDIWQSTGWGSIIYLAALANINTELIEAADIDGANRIQKIRYIDIPTIKPTAILLFIFSVGGIMGIGHEKAYLMQTSLNIQASEILPTYTYKQGLQMGNYSYSAAVGLFNSVINLILLLVANLGVEKLSEEEGLL